MYCVYWTSATLCRIYSNWSAQFESFLVPDYYTKKTEYTCNGNKKCSNEVMSIECK